MRFLLLLAVISCAPLTAYERTTREAEIRFDMCHEGALNMPDMRRCFEASREYCRARGQPSDCGTTGYAIRAGHKRGEK